MAISAKEKKVELEEGYRETLRGMMSEWEELRALENENDGVVDDEISKRIALLEIDIPEKIDAWCYVMDQYELSEDHWKNQEDFAKFNRKLSEDRLKSIKLRFKQMMEERDLKKVFGKVMEFQRVEYPQKLEVTNESAIPVKYFKQEVVFTLDREKLKTDMLADPTLKINGAHMEKVFALRRGANKQNAAKTKRKEFEDLQQPIQLEGTNGNPNSSQQIQ